MTWQRDFRFRLRNSTGLLAAAFLILTGSLIAADRPNVIVIMADDIGAEGLACYGSTIYTTPHLDQMAAEGVRFNNAYATPLCTPTRVMIMSGLYPNRTGYRSLIGKGKGIRLVPDIRTFAHDFRDAGYATAIAGKWQLGKFDEYPQQPVQHGFDEYCMWTWIYEGKKASRYYGPQIYREDTIINGAPEDFGPDDYREFVLDFIDRKKDEPFFFYFPMALVHSPFINPPALKERSESKFTDDLDKQTRAFGHMITYMDQVVGDILSKLKEHNLEENTLVLFTGDNGTHKSITSKLPDLDIKGGKGSMTEAGSRVPLLAWWPAKVKPGVRDEFFCLVDVLPTIQSIAGIELDREVDGMDLSHLIMGGEGTDRERVLINYGRGYFVREERFRLNQDGNLYDIPITSDASRYSETITTDAAHEADRNRLQAILDDFMAIEAQYDEKASSGGKKKQPSKM
ncbi:sulfatase-like hydrolase/transferase [Thalassoglobus sp. JC818]|uniref:sulfatase-like hydrolase/transferase n=1 Tax=Thalassoglobus sp. JC818 TaxID=3232136 RepID=UPI003459F2A9